MPVFVLKIGDIFRSQIESIYAIQVRLHVGSLIVGSLVYRQMAP